MGLRNYIVLFIFLSSTFLYSCRDTLNQKEEMVFLHNNWKIRNSEKVKASGKEISSVNFIDSNWFTAYVPSTVLYSLAKSGIYCDIYKDNNIDTIDKNRFKTSWWYRKEFNYDNNSKVSVLHFDGINYKANIWLNGIRIADNKTVKNTFRQFDFDISSIIKKGKNVLAVEVFPPVKGDFSIGFVDWNPTPPDNNMGLIRDVYIEFNSGVEISNPYVTSALNDKLDQAKLSSSIDIKNYTGSKQEGVLTLKIMGKEISKKYNLSPKESKTIKFSHEEFDQLIVKNPELWWPHTIGKPTLHQAVFYLKKNGDIVSTKTVKFGIRTVSDYFTKSGHRGFKINGKKILIRGGGWVDKMLLEDTRESILNQLEYVKDMNLNSIRLEGFWGKNQSLYDICDSLGILIMVGWSCQWEWEDYLGKPCSEEYGGVLSKTDIEMISDAWQDQIVWLRNHPAIYAWVGGSDCKPKPELENNYLDIFSRFDTTRIYLASAKEWTSQTGFTGVKMRGPYAYVPPVYWYSDTLYGGAFGFNTETGPGAQVPPVESIKKMLSEEHWWPIDSMWDFHCGRHEFNSLSRYNHALEKRYGKAFSLEEYAQKAQLLNYELMRPMFEAFSANRYNATGVIQWMLNSAWPEMYWQLYDYFLNPNGAYFGAKKASQPYHAVYNYNKHSIFVINDKLQDMPGCNVLVRILDINSDIIYTKEINVDLKANSSTEILKLPEINKNLYFLDLRITDKNQKEIDNNFYWLSKKKDILDYKAIVPGWNYHTPSKQYADFTALNNMTKVDIITEMKKEKRKDDTKFNITVKNPNDKIAFFIRINIVDEYTKDTILPVLWSDNYITLLPHETREITATIKNKHLKYKKPKLETDWFNK